MIISLAKIRLTKQFNLIDLSCCDNKHFQQSFMKNLIVSENKALIFNFLKKKTTTKKTQKKHTEDIFS